MPTFPTETTTLLERTPQLLRTLLVGLPPAWTDTPDTADGWRPRDVVGHLITGEQTDWMARTRRILEHGTAVPFDRFDREAMLEQFVTLRTANLAELAALATDADLDRRGMHPALGEVTLRELLATWVP